MESTLPWSPWIARLRAAGSIRDGASDRRLRYEPAFEGLRSVLLLLVIVSHGQSYLLHLPGEPLVQGFGIMPAFFVLSGFLIGSIVLTTWQRTGSIGFRGYARRRLTRLGIPIALYVVVHFVIALVLHVGLSNWGTTLGELWSDFTILTFTSNLVPSFGYTVPFDAGQMWSLGVDMQLYFVLPFVILLFLKRLDRPLRIVVAGLVVAAVVHVIRFAEFHHFYGGPKVVRTWAGLNAVDSVYQRPETSLDAFVVGFVMLVLWKKDLLPTELLRRLAIPATIGFVACVVLIPLKGPFAYSFGYPIVTLFACVAVAESLRPESVFARVLGAYPLRLIGRISFSLYIWHLFVFVLVSRWLPRDASPATRFVVGTVSLIVVACAAWWIAERPLLRLPPVGVPRFVERRRAVTEATEGVGSGDLGPVRDGS